MKITIQKLKCFLGFHRYKDFDIFVSSACLSCGYNKDTDDDVDNFPVEVIKIELGAGKKNKSKTSMDGFPLEGAK